MTSTSRTGLTAYTASFTKKIPFTRIFPFPQSHIPILSPMFQFLQVHAHQMLVKISVGRRHAWPKKFHRSNSTLTKHYQLTTHLMMIMWLYLDQLKHKKPKSGWNSFDSGLVPYSGRQDFQTERTKVSSSIAFISSSIPAGSGEKTVKARTS